MKKYLNPLTGITAIGLLYMVYIQKNQIAELKKASATTIKCDSLQRLCDSLHDADYVKSIELGRYEMIFDQIDQECSSDCKDQIYEITKNIE